MRDFVTSIPTSQIGVNLSNPIGASLGSGGIKQSGGLFGSLLGSATGGIDPTGILGGLTTQLLSKAFESKAARNSRLVQQVLEQSKRDSNVSSGTLQSYNEYLKQLSRWYKYQYSVKGRSEGSLILDTLNQVKNALTQNGFKQIATKNASQVREGGKGSFNYDYPVFAQDSFFASESGVKSNLPQKNTATKQSFVGQNSDNSVQGSDEPEKSFNPLWLLLLVPVALVAMFYKKIFKK